MDREEFEDWLSDVIDDSIDVDWTARWAARLIIDRLQQQGLLVPVLLSMTGAE